VHAKRARKLTGLGSLAVGIMWLALDRARSGDNASAPPAVQHPSELTFTRALTPLLNDPTLRRELAGKSAAEAEAYTSNLAAEGVPALDADALEEWTRLRSLMADESRELCAAMWKGGMTSDMAFDALDRLSPADQRRFGELSARAGLLMLHDQRPQPPLSMTLQDGLALVVTTLWPSERTAFETDVVNARLTDERACELMKTVLAAAKTLPSLRRTAFHRAIARGH
jgi:hypothetical protein